MKHKSETKSDLNHADKDQDKEAKHSTGGIKRVYGIEDIWKILPQRYPFLMVDRFEVVEPESHGVGYKNVSINEPHFQGHFPGNPIMPGVMSIEALAQTAGLAAIVANPAFVDKNMEVLLLSIEKAKFRGLIRPGDQLKINVNMISNRRGIWRYEGICSVDDKVVLEASIAAMLRVSNKN